MLRVIGDVHGEFDKYELIAKKSEYSLQIGDFGFASTWNRLGYSGLNPENHKVLSGNHDCYDSVPHSPHHLGDFGEATIGGVAFFFIRGGLSLDRVRREVDRMNLGTRSWWSQEELNFTEMLSCMRAYKKAKPSIVISHVPCAEFTKHICPNDDILVKYGFHRGFKEATQLLGDELFKIHKPKLWISGHMHRNKISNIGKTKFVSIDILTHIDIDSDGNIS